MRSFRRDKIWYNWCPYACMKVQLVSHVQLLTTPWIVASRLLCPWDFPGKNTGVGCQLLLWRSSPPRDQTCISCMIVRFLTTEPPLSFFCPWDFTGKNTGVGCHSLLQRDLPDSGIEPMSLAFPAFAGGFFTPSTTWEAPFWALTWSFIIPTSQVRKLRLREVKRPTQAPEPWCSRTGPPSSSEEPWPQAPSALSWIPVPTS